MNVISYTDCETISKLFEWIHKRNRFHLPIKIVDASFAMCHFDTFSSQRKCIFIITFTKYPNNLSMEEVFFMSSLKHVDMIVHPFIYSANEKVEYMSSMNKLDETFSIHALNFIPSLMLNKIGHSDLFGTSHI